MRTIQDALSGLAPPPKSVDVSIVTQTVVVRHAVSISSETIKAALDDVGFDIVSTPLETAPQSSFSGGVFQPIFGPKRDKHVQQCAQCQAEHADRENHLLDVKIQDVKTTEGPLQLVMSVGGMTCASCTNTITDALQALPGVSNVAVNLLGNSASVNVDGSDRVKAVVDAIEDAGYEAEVVSAQPFANTDVKPSVAAHITLNDAFQLTLSIGGMTCASCVNTVTETMMGTAGVSNAVVNLLGNSATALVTSEKAASTVAEAIEDGGYEVQIMSLEPVPSGEDHEIGVGIPLARTVALHIDGMTCP